MSLLDKLHRNDLGIEVRPERRFGRGRKTERGGERTAEDDQIDADAAERLATVALNANVGDVDLAATIGLGREEVEVDASATGTVPVGRELEANVGVAASADVGYDGDVVGEIEPTFELARSEDGGDALEEEGEQGAGQTRQPGKRGPKKRRRGLRKLAGKAIDRGLDAVNDRIDDALAPIAFGTGRLEQAAEGEGLVAHEVTHVAQQGRGAPPSAEASAEAMQLFREVNDDAGPSTARGAPPSAEASAEAMQLFREVNGDAESSVREDLVAHELAHVAQQGRGAPPSAEGSAAAMQLFREVNGDADPSAARGAPPRAEASAAAMQLFREVNGDAESSTREDVAREDVAHEVTHVAQQGRGAPPSAEASAEAMQLFREVNGDAEPTAARGAPPSADGSAEAMQLFREVNGDVDPSAARGAPPSAEGSAEAMQLFREVNGDADADLDEEGLDDGGGGPAELDARIGDPTEGAAPLVLDQVQVSSPPQSTAAAPGRRPQAARRRARGPRVDAARPETVAQPAPVQDADADRDTLTPQAAPPVTHARTLGPPARTPSVAQPQPTRPATAAKPEVAPSTPATPARAREAAPTPATQIAANEMQPAVVSATPAGVGAADPVAAPPELLVTGRLPGGVTMFGDRTTQSIQRFARVSLLSDPLEQQGAQLDERTHAMQQDRLGRLEARLDEVAGAPAARVASAPPAAAAHAQPQTETGAEAPTVAAQPDRLAAIRREGQREQQAILAEAQQHEQQVVAQSQQQAQRAEHAGQRRVQGAARRGQRAQQTMQRRGEQQQQQTQITIETLRQQIQTSYELQKQRIEQMEETQRQVLVQTRVRLLEDLHARVAAEIERVEVEKESRVAVLQEDIGRRKTERQQQTRQEIQAAEQTTRAEQEQTRQHASQAAERTLREHEAEARAMREQGSRDAAARRERGSREASAVIAQGNARAQQLAATAQRRAARIDDPGRKDAAISDGERQAAAARRTAAQRAAAMRNAAASEAQAIRERANARAEAHLAAGRTAAQQLQHDAEQACQRLDATLAQTRQRLQRARDVALAQMDTSLAQGIREASAWVEAMRQDQEFLLQQDTERINEEFRTGLIEMQRDVAEQQAAALQQLEQWKTESEQMLAQRTTADAALVQQINQQCVAIEQSVLGVEQQVQAAIGRAAGRASQIAEQRVAAFRANADRGVAAVGRMMDRAAARVAREDQLAQQRLQRESQHAQQRLQTQGQNARADLTDQASLANTSGRSPRELAAERRRIERAQAARAAEERQAQQQFESREHEISAQEVTERQRDAEDRTNVARDELAQSRYQLRGERQPNREQLGRDADNLYNAMHGGLGWGTDEDRIRQILSGKSPAEMEVLRAEYARRNDGRDLMRDLESELSGEDLRAARLLMSGNPADQAVGNLINATTAGWTGAGTDEALLEQTLRDCRDPFLREQIAARYQEVTGRSLEQMIRAESSGIRRDMFHALASGDEDAANAARAEQAMHGGVITNFADWTAERLGTDRNATRRVLRAGQYDNNGTDEVALRDVVDSYRNRHTEVMSDEERARAEREEGEALGRLERAYVERNTGTGDRPTTLRADIEAETAGAERDQVVYGLEQRWDDARAARIRAATDGNGTLFGGWGTDVDDAAGALENTTRAEREGALDAYNRQAGQSFDDLLASGEFRKLEAERMRQTAESGKMRDGFAIYYAGRGQFWGTDEDRINEILRGRSRQEIARIEQEYAEETERFEGVRRDLREDLADEMDPDGDEGFDVQLMLLGEPETPREKLEREEMRRAHDRSGGIANWVTDLYSDSGKRQDRFVEEARAELERLEQVMPGISNLRFEDLQPEQRQALEEFAVLVGVSQSASENHRATMNAATETVATAAGVVAGVVVTAATAGAAAPVFVAAFAGGMASGLTTMAVRGIMMGDKYTPDAIGRDLVVTVASAVTSGYVQAGSISNFVTSTLTRMRVPEGLMRTMLQNITSEALGGGLSSGVQAALSEEALRGDFAHFVRTVAAQGGQGALDSLFSGVGAGVLEQYLPEDLDWTRSRVVNRAIREGIEEGGTDLIGAVINPETYASGRIEDNVSNIASETTQSAMMGAAMGGGRERAQVRAEGAWTTTTEDVFAPSTPALEAPSHTSDIPSTNALEVAPATQVDTAPATQVDTAPATQVDTAPATHVDTAPTTQLDTAPATQLDTAPATQVDTAPATQVDTLPTTQVDTAPATQVDTAPATQVDTAPTTQVDTAAKVTDASARSADAPSADVVEQRRAIVQAAVPNLQQAQQSLYEHFNDDAVFDRVYEYAQQNPAAPVDDLAFHGFSSQALEGIVQSGLRSGKSFGKQGINAENIWFKSGAPFYADGLALVIPKARLEALGGQDSVGLAGQEGVMRLHHDALPSGIPIEEFAIVYSVGWGYVVPVYVPPGWSHPLGRELPADLLPSSHAPIGQQTPDAPTEVPAPATMESTTESPATEQPAALQSAEADAARLDPGREALPTTTTADTAVERAADREPIADLQTLREIAHGEKLVDLIDELGNLTRETGYEHAIVSMQDGTRLVIRSNRIDALALPQGTRRLIFHTHPSGSTDASVQDIEALRYLGDTARGGQRHSYIVAVTDTGEQIARFSGNSATSLAQRWAATAATELGFTPTVRDPGIVTEADAIAEESKPDRTQPKPDTETAGDKRPDDGAIDLANPKTLGAVLAVTGKTPKSLTDPWILAATAKELLAAKGITEPTKSQLDETQYQISEVIKTDNWQSFTAPFEAGALKLEDNVNQRLGNIFYEKQVFTPDQLRPEALQLTPSERERLEGGFESGRTGAVLSASFINTQHRSEGDFSRAYGEDAWQGFIRAHTFLSSIPKGQFLERLDVDLMMEVNRLIHAPDTGMKAALLRTIAMIGRGGKWDKGGELRDGRQYARWEHYTKQEKANLTEAGVRVIGDMDSDGKARLEYPRPETVRPTLEALVTKLREDLAKPDADPIMAASEFQRKFVALHPFGDSNGRTSRVVMNRILAEFDMPPAILADQNRDISLSAQEWRDEVAKGVARSKKYLSQADLKSRDDYLGNMNIRAVDVSPNKPITLSGLPFDLGTDGFLYDPTGRPWIAQNNEVIPLAQLEHYVLARRVLQSGENATDRLKSITDATRALYDQVAADPEAGKQIVVRSDARARRADIDHKLAPDAEVAQLLAQLTDLSATDPKVLFSIEGQTGKGTAVSSTMSRHAQIDLELWYVERGLRDAGHDDLADQVRQQRARLFEAAKAALDATRDASRVSAENPMGFRYRYEKMMYDTSPLRFESFDAAVSEMGDNKLTVWRGDYGFARLIGMAPNNDIRQPDAKAVAEQRAQKNQITNLYDDLVKLEGSAVGRQYICTTSDLALLSKAFANTSNTQTVSLAGLPTAVKERILNWIAHNGPDGVTQEEIEKTRKAAIDRGDSIVPGPDGGKELKDALGIPGTIVTVRIVDKDAGKIEVNAQRKAFQITIDKDAVLPGIYTLGGPVFEAEQELHGLERVMPWKIKGTYEATTLGEEFPVVGSEPGTDGGTTEPAG